MIKTKYILPVFIVLFCMSTFNFYAPGFVSLRVLRVLLWMFILIVFSLSLRQFLTIKPKKHRYFYEIRYIVFAMAFSIVPAYFFWGQSPIASIRATIPYFSFILFFFLIRFRPSVEILEKIIWVLCIAYLVVYLYSLTHLSSNAFGNNGRGSEDSRGFTRLFIPGRSFVYFAYFLALSKYARLKNTFWLSITLGLFIVIVLHVIRQYILFSFLIGFLIVFKHIKLWKKISLIIIIISSSVYLYEQFPILQVLVELTEGQIKNSGSGSGDIRMISYKYFFTEFSPSFICDIFGNGVPHISSSYGVYYKSYVNFKGMYMSDVGYAQIFALFGFVGLVLFVLLFCKALTHKNLPREIVYVKWFVLFMVLSNILSGLVLLSSSIVCLMIAFYILEFAYRGNFTQTDS